MKLTINMSLDNDAFHVDDPEDGQDEIHNLDYTSVEVAVATAVERSVRYGLEPTPVIDLNGNNVGTLTIEAS